MPTPQPQKQAMQPRGAIVGPPHMPKLYGPRKRKEYLPWSHAEERLARSRNYWICTSRPDGRPHSIPLWGIWIEGALYFGTARSTRKAHNLEHNPAVSVHLESGDDVVILEGRAVEVSDPATFKKLDAASRVKYNMPLVMIPGESVMYCVRPRVVLAWLEKDMPGTGTRWEFADES
ncbi:MAG TPA: pyridoxamine 5'-phosphate oxidase family protein [Candidatus Acidoferrales bacterium]|nr:pyridoxamine 5'-phosphate oxidase family protein [Candidatus Acidoferrales bacterium]